MKYFYIINSLLSINTVLLLTLCLTIFFKDFNNDLIKSCENKGFYIITHNITIKCSVENNK